MPTYGKLTLTEWWWSRMYKSYHIRVEREYGYATEFTYLLASVSLRVEKCPNLKKIMLDELVLEMLGKSQHWRHFFSNSGEIQTSSIYVPMEPFFIKSDTTNSKSLNIKIYPIIDKENNIVGLDFWTSQWFWGVFDKDSERVFRKTVDELSKVIPIKDGTGPSGVRQFLSQIFSRDKSTRTRTHSQPPPTSRPQSPPQSPPPPVTSEPMEIPSGQPHPLTPAFYNTATSTPTTPDGSGTGTFELSRVAQAQSFPAETAEPPRRRPASLAGDSSASGGRLLDKVSVSFSNLKQNARDLVSR